MRSKRTKKIFSVLLALALAVTLTPMTAFSAGETISYPGNGVLRADPALSWSDSLFPDALSSNNVTVNSGNIPGGVFGGVSDGSYTVTNNTVIIKGGTIDLTVFGGYSENGDATGSSVTVNGGTINNDVRGGSSNDSGEASNNSVTINGGTVNGFIIGGWNNLGNATGNTVTISGSTTFHPANTALCGGIGGPGADQFTGNTLNVHNYNGGAVIGVQNFEIFNFSIPSNQSDPVLTVNGSATLGDGVTLIGSTVTIDVTGTPLAVGSTITLIEAGTLNLNGFTQTTATGGRYTFALSVDDSGATDKLIAEVTSYTPPKSGGGGGMSGMNSYLSNTKASFDKSKPGNVSVNVSGAGSLTGIKNGDYTLKEGADYTVKANSVIFSASYLSGLPAGEQKFTFEMDGSRDLTFTVTVSGSAADSPAPSKPEPMKPDKPAGTIVDADKTNNPLILDGEQVDFPAVKIDGWNWLKLRDVAMLLDGTSKQFSIGYDEATNTIVITTGEEYEPLGDELIDMLSGDFTAVASGQQILFNGQLVDIAAYNIDGYNYFRLRDLMILLDIAVIYDGATGEITLDLTKSYEE